VKDLGVSVNDQNTNNLSRRCTATEGGLFTAPDNKLFVRSNTFYSLDCSVCAYH